MNIIWVYKYFKEIGHSTLSLFYYSYYFLYSSDKESSITPLSTFLILSSWPLLLKKRINMIEAAAKVVITIIGIGSSNSFTNGAPIVIVFETRTTMLVAVVLYLNGKILSSWKAV